MKLTAVIIVFGVFCCMVSCSSHDELIADPIVAPGVTDGGEDNVVSREGMTVIGRVTDLSGNPVEGVVVSDGICVTATDADGCYWLPSGKETGFVFISIPGGYTVDCIGSRPQFFHYTKAAADVEERHDFILIPADNSEYAVIVHSDQHLANRSNEDVRQFRSVFIPDINNTIADLRAQGKSVYSISLGDMSCDQYWYNHQFDLSDSAVEFDKIDCPVFHVMGNHDNDPYCPGDWSASHLFRATLAPSYYSFNIGRTHYVVLDNVVYINDGASQGTIGDREYDKAITRQQLDWLRRDLSYVADRTTPLVIASHAQFHKQPSLSGQEQTTTRNLDNMEEFEAVVAGYADVTLLSGHIHRNFHVDSPYVAGMREFNVAAVCGSLWWTGCTGYAGNHLCSDGAPGGYGIWEVDASGARYRYKGMDCPDDYQFRVYDLNKVVINEACVTRSSYKSYVKEYADAYGKVSTSNDILINVFNFGPGWTVSVTEQGRALGVSRVRAKDPLHILSYECMCLSNGRLPNAGANRITYNSTHFFKTRASSATSTVTVRVTDPWGRVYEEDVKRPKAFNVSMR